MTFLFDTNILIDYENGIAAAASLPKGVSDGIISRISWMELLAGVDQTNFEDYQKVRSTLAMFEVVELDEKIASVAAMIHQERVKAKKAGDAIGKIKHSDCIVHATAMLMGATLVTRNPKDFTPVPVFGELNIGVETPYEV